MKIKPIIKNKPFKFESSCLMAGANADFKKSWLKILNLVDKQDIYNTNGFGLEHNPHITILFGFNDKTTNFEDIENKLKDFKNPFSIKITGISYFENKEYDVLKLDIESDTLNELNNYFRSNFEYKNDYPVYKPHMTISYLNKGTGKKYTNKKFVNNLNVKVDKFLYSRPNEIKITRNIPIVQDNKQQDISKFDTIIGDIIKRLKLPSTYTVRGSKYGKIYNFENQRCLKITTNRYLAEKAEKYRNKIVPNTKNIFKVYKIKRIKKDNKDIYVILFDNLRDYENLPI